MPEIPQFRQYVSSRVGQPTANAAPNANVNTFDPIFEAEIDKWGGIAHAAGVIGDSISKFFEQRAEENEREKEVEDILAYQKEDGDFKIALAKRLAEEPDVEKHPAIYDEMTGRYATQQMANYGEAPPRLRLHVENNLVRLKEGIIPRYEDAAKARKDRIYVSAMTKVVDEVEGTGSLEERKKEIAKQFSEMRYASVKTPAELDAEEKSALHNASWNTAAQMVRANPALYEESLKVGRFSDLEREKLSRIRDEKVREQEQAVSKVEYDQYFSGLTTMFNPPDEEGKRESLSTAVSVEDVEAQLPGIGKANAVRLLDAIKTEQLNNAKAARSQAIQDAKDKVLTLLPNIVATIEGMESKRVEDYVKYFDYSSYMPPGVREHVRSLIRDKLDTQKGEKIPEPLKATYDNFVKDYSKAYFNSMPTKEYSWFGSRFYGYITGAEYSNYLQGQDKADEGEQQRIMEQYLAVKSNAKWLAMQPGMTPEKFNEYTRDAINKQKFRETWNVLMARRRGDK